MDRLRFSRIASHMDCIPVSRGGAEARFVILQDERLPSLQRPLTLALPILNSVFQQKANQNFTWGTSRSAWFSISKKGSSLNPKGPATRLLGIVLILVLKAITLSL